MSHLGQGDPRDGVVARIGGTDKPPGHRGAEHIDTQAPVGQRLLVVRDGVVVDRGNAERARDV